jgi:polysaccharide export outer membrane protein
MKLMPGSMLSLHVFEEPDLDGAYRIDSNGAIFIPLVGSIRVGSLTLRDAERAVESQLMASGILVDPHVVLNITDYGAQTVVVAGEVTAPGRLPILSPRKLQDILAMAGGTTPLAGDEVVIHHADQPARSIETIHYNPAQGGVANLDTLIQPGDTVFVKKAGSVYVLGAVYRPGGFIMQEAGTLNVVQALALAYGTSPEAAITKVRILRKSSDGSYTFIPVPLNKIQKGRANPTPLQSEDIVYVPPSTLKEVGISARSLLSGVAGAAVYRVN